MINRRWYGQMGGILLSSAMLFALPVGCANSSPLPITINAPATQVQAEDVQPLLAADVIYLAEQHDSEADHAAQLAIIAALYAENPNLAIAFEMFQRPFQPILDRYAAGEITEAEFIQQTEYEQRWGFPWEFYAPVLRFAQAHDLPIVALNAPSEVVRQVAREGVDSLDDSDLRYIPPIAELDTSNSAYREFVAGVFGAHGGHGNFNFDNFFAAQVVWDETMAAAIADFKQANPDTTVVVLAGSGHVVYDFGIPSRVERRLADIDQQTILLNPSASELAGSEQQAAAIADILWYSE